MERCPDERRSAITISQKAATPGPVFVACANILARFGSRASIRQTCGARRAYGRPHEFDNWDMAAPTVRARMARNPLTAMEYLDRLPCYAHINLLLDLGEGDGIPGAVDFDVIIRRDAGALTQNQIGRAKT